MAKTDKELTAEIVCSFVNAWGVSSNCTPPRADGLCQLIEDVYDTVSKLNKNDSDAET